jgi:hypothetical protein
MLLQVLVQLFVTYENCSILKADSSSKNSLLVGGVDALQLTAANACSAVRKFNCIMVNPTVFNANALTRTFFDQ